VFFEERNRGGLIVSNGEKLLGRLNFDRLFLKEDLRKVFVTAVLG